VKLTHPIQETQSPYTETEKISTTIIPLSSTSSVFLDSTFKNRKIPDTQETDNNTNQHRILIPKGKNCKPRYPVDFNYARGMLIMHKPWHKNNSLDQLIMLDAKEVPTSVLAQYVTAMYYAK
jgi:hypothetical protein